MADHIVTAALVITKKEDGSDLYLYEGAVVPSFVSADELKRLAAEGFIDKATKATLSPPVAESN